MKNICNKIHFTLYRVRIGLGDEAWDKVRLEVRNQGVNQGVNQVMQNVKL